MPADTYAIGSKSLIIFSPVRRNAIEQQNIFLYIGFLIGFCSGQTFIKFQHSSKPVNVVRHFMRPPFIAILLLTLTACGQTGGRPQKVSSNNSVDTTQKQTKSMSDYSPTPGNAHPNAKRLMNEEFYWSPIEETAPFGSDDGADTFAGFADWRKSHKTNSPNDFLMEQIDYWGYPTFDLNETNFERLKPYLKQNELGNRFMSGIDAAIVAIAFGQLYLEGTVDKDFKELTKTSIHRQLIPEMLDLWGSEYKPVRITQLKKMLAVLNQVD